MTAVVSPAAYWLGGTAGRGGCIATGAAARERAGSTTRSPRRPAGEWTPLARLGLWPWCALSAPLVALALSAALDAPFWTGRRRAASDDAGQDRATHRQRAPAPGRA